MATDKSIFSDKDDAFIVDVPKEARHLNTSSYDYSVDFIVSMMQGDNPKIILEVPFQRKYIWQDDKASQLVESIVMNVPIPPLYFAEEEDGKWLVIDGLQRLYSLLRFYQNEFGLKKLDILTDLDKDKYKDLPPKAKSLLGNGQLRINVIKHDSHPDIKYDIFMRLNKGAVTLNYQELRNCLFRGGVNDLAKSLVQDNHDFLEILNLKEPHSRFLDVEFIIRFFALSHNLTQASDGSYYVNGYQGRMVAFLNNFMKETKNISSQEISIYEQAFNDVIQKVVAVFGVEEAFRDISTTKSKVNRALADAIMLGFLYPSLEEVMQNRDEIRTVLLGLLNEDSIFKSSISLRTSDKDVLNYRVNKWLQTLSDVVEI